MSDKKPYAVTVAERIINQLSQGTAPWVRPWEPGQFSRPFNPTTGKPYRGINSLLLGMESFADPRWLTFKQAEEKGWRIKKGAKASLIQFWQFYENAKVSDEGHSTQVKLDRPRVFNAHVFNGEQIDGIPELVPTQINWSANERAESILLASGADIRHDGENQAFYRYSTDTIHLPELSQFPSAGNYYAIAMHELGHWTGHESRLNRNLFGGFGSPDYAQEELRAEIASFMLNSEIGLGHNPDRHAGYIESWIQVLRNDPTEIFRAARDAENIKDFVMDLELRNTAELENPPLVSQSIEGVDLFYQFAGKKSHTAPLEKLVQAMELSKSRFSMESIRHKTQWFKGLDDKWRYEISDHQARLINPPIKQTFEEYRDSRVQEVYGPNLDIQSLSHAEFSKLRDFFGELRDEYDGRNGTRRLDEILDHPELFQAYPQVRDLLVVPHLDLNASGMLYHSLSRMDLLIDTEKEMLSTILHEIQHEIQCIENFAKGGNMQSEFVRRVKDVLSYRVEAVENKISTWKTNNQSLLQEAEEKSKLAFHALLYHSAMTLIGYAERETLTNVFRHIRNEFQWLYSAQFGHMQKAKDLQRELFTIPPRHKKNERNEFLRSMCLQVARLLRSQIPDEQLLTFEQDTRRLNYLVKSLQKKALRAREQLYPLQDLEKELTNCATIYELNRFSTGREIYRSLAGEAEARNTERRQDLDEEERRLTSPVMTMDIKPDQVIVIFGGCESAAHRLLTPTLSTEQIQHWADQFQSSITHPIQIKVAASVNDMPTYIKAQIKADNSKSETIKALAFQNREVWLNASALVDKLDIEKALFHEIYGHIGVHELFGDKCQIALHNLFIEVGGEAGLRRITRKHDIDFDAYREQAHFLKLDDYRRDCLMTAECLAIIAEENKPTFMQSIKEIIGAILSWLREKGFECLPKVTHSEILYLLKDAKNTIQSGVIPESPFVSFLKREHESSIPLPDKELPSKFQMEA